MELSDTELGNAKVDASDLVPGVTGHSDFIPRMGTWIRLGKGCCLGRRLRPTRAHVLDSTQSIACSCHVVAVTPKASLTFCKRHGEMNDRMR